MVSAQPTVAIDSSTLQPSLRRLALCWRLPIAVPALWRPSASEVAWWRRPCNGVRVEAYRFVSRAFVAGAGFSSGSGGRRRLRMIIAGQVGVAGGGADRVMAQKLLDLLQIHASFDQVGRVAVAKAVGRDVFLASSMLTMSGSRWTLGGRISTGIVHGRRSTCSV
jgi:hypothetical protein